MLATHFAPAERLEDSDLQQSIESIVHHPILNVIMETHRGLIAILNQYRQVVAMNRGLMDRLGIDDPDQYFGQRPGEILDCVHSHEMEGGCGTALACSSCGAVLAVLAARGSKNPVEKDCILSVTRQGKRHEIVFRINACPLCIADEAFIMVTFRDVTRDYRRRIFERSFLHDLSNIVSAGRMLLDETSEGAMEVEGQIMETRLLLERLVRELEIQRSLINDIDFQPEFKFFDVGMFLHDLAMRCSYHPVATGRKIRLGEVAGGVRLKSDPLLLGRVLENLVLNACEAAEDGETVRISVVSGEGVVCFSVHNPGMIPIQVRPRIFQRYFTTKPGKGRGMGTYSSRLFVESMLDGSIDFSTDPDQGTVFSIRLPLVIDR